MASLLHCAIAVKWPILFATSALATFCSLPAFAQRGDLSADASRPARESSPLDGFPGTFNGAMPESGEWLLEASFTPSLSYGIHEDAAVRTSLYPVVAWSTGSPGGSAELRYRLWHDRRWALVGSFGGTLVRVGRADVRAVKASLTAEWRYSSRSALALTVVGGGAKLWARAEMDDAQMTTVEGGYEMEGVGVMATYSWFPARWFGFDIGLGIAPHLAAAETGTGGSMSIDLDSVIEASHGLGGQLVFHVKPGATWLVDLGAVFIPPAIPVPVLGVSKRW